MGILDDLKRAEDLARQMDDSPLFELILNIRSQVVDLQSQIVELKREKTELSSRLASIEEDRELKRKMVFDRGVGWILMADGKKDGPFCPNCRGSSKEPIRLVPLENPAYVLCPTCKIRIRLYPERDKWGQEVVEDFEF